jgi:hypothetical protein
VFSEWIGSLSSAEVPSLRSSRSCFASQSPRIWFCFHQARMTYVLLPLDKCHLTSFTPVQVGRQNAAECIPLIMEPKSDFYNSPLLVLDFQSLYPSIMIAYNYCYSTCLGRAVDFKGRNKFGVTDLPRVPGLLGTMESHINGLCVRCYTN